MVTSSNTIIVSIIYPSKLLIPPLMLCFVLMANLKILTSSSEFLSIRQLFFVGDPLILKKKKSGIFKKYITKCQSPIIIIILTAIMTTTTMKPEPLNFD